MAGDKFCTPCDSESVVDFSRGSAIEFSGETCIADNEEAEADAVSESPSEIAVAEEAKRGNARAFGGGIKSEAADLAGTMRQWLAAEEAIARFDVDGPIYAVTGGTSMDNPGRQI